MTRRGSFAFGANFLGLSFLLGFTLVGCVALSGASEEFGAKGVAQEVLDGVGVFLGWGTDRYEHPLCEGVVVGAEQSTAVVWTALTQYGAVGPRVEFSEKFVESRKKARNVARIKEPETRYFCVASSGSAECCTDHDCDAGLPYCDAVCEDRCRLRIAYVQQGTECQGLIEDNKSFYFMRGLSEFFNPNVTGVAAVTRHRYFVRPDEYEPDLPKETVPGVSPPTPPTERYAVAVRNELVGAPGPEVPTIGMQTVWRRLSQVETGNAMLGSDLGKDVCWVDPIAALARASEQASHVVYYTQFFDDDDRLGIKRVVTTPIGPYSLTVEQAGIYRGSVRLLNGKFAGFVE